MNVISETTVACLLPASWVAQRLYCDALHAATGILFLSSGQTHHSANLSGRAGAGPAVIALIPGEVEKVEKNILDAEGAATC